MKILAVDLGTVTGVVHNFDPDELFTASYTWASKEEISEWGKSRLTRRDDPRIYRLYEWAQRAERPDLVIFEDVAFSSTTYQCQLWSSLRTALWLGFPWAKFECVPVTTLKKFATGHGGATKRMMSDALSTQSWWPIPVDTMDDNQVDAAWLFEWAKRKFRT